MKIALAANTSWNIVNFRAGLVEALAGDGHDVVAITPTDESARDIEALGCRHVPVIVDCHGTSPLRDAHLFWQYLSAFRSERPDVILGYTIKPNIYGSLACSLLDIPIINNISGLGTTFLRKGLAALIVRQLYRLALRKSKRVFFQNEDDRRLFVGERIVRKSQAGLLPGSGVDLAYFKPGETLKRRKQITFLMIARLLRDKGVEEYVETTRAMAMRQPGVVFQLLGSLDPQNPNGVSPQQIDQWAAEGIIEYIGKTADVRPAIENADCVVLPSYREGTPRVLLEAAAMAKPLIATDVPGCRDVIQHGHNGFLCSARDANSLGEALERFVALSHLRRTEMGKRSRELVERKYDEKFVVDAYREELAAITASRPEIRRSSPSKTGCNDFQRAESDQQIQPR